MKGISGQKSGTTKTESYRSTESFGPLFSKSLKTLIVVIT